MHGGGKCKVKGGENALLDTVQKRREKKKSPFSFGEVPILEEKSEEESSRFAR